MAQTPNLKLPLMTGSQAQKHVTHNEAIYALDSLAQLTFQSANLTNPPLSALEGHQYIVAQSSQGVWDGREGQIARYDGQAWQFSQPQLGWIGWVIDESALVVFDGQDWGDVITPSGGSESNQFETLGVNAAADTVNRLSVNSQATLLNNDGASHQLKINKAASTDTASLVFQTGFSGKAELGLSGNNNLSFKVTDDGINWFQPISTKSSNGYVGINTDAPATVFHIAQALDYKGMRISGYDNEASDYLDLHVGGALSRITTNKSQMWFLVDGSTPLKLTKTAVRVAGDLDMDSNLTIKDDKHLRLGTNWDFRLSYSDAEDQLKLTDSGAKVYLSVKKSGNNAEFNFNADDVFISSTGLIGLGTSQPSCRLDVDGAIKAKSYTVATVPDASTIGAGAMIFVSDETGGAVMAFSDGGNWRRMTDRAIVT